MRPKKNPGSTVANGPGPGRGRGRGGGRARTQVSDEEDERRKLRRERNKLAAARCRKRRVDHTQNLLDETEELESRKKSLQEEIQKLNSQCDELSFILESHQNQRNIKSEFENQENFSICKLHNNNNNNNNSSSNKNDNNMSINNNNNNNNKSTTKRPTTLPIVPSAKITRQSSVIKKSPTSQAASVIVANLMPTPSQLMTPSTGLFDWSEFPSPSLTGIFTSTNSNSTPSSNSVINKNTNSLQTPI